MITDDDIRALSWEAGEAGDLEQFALCVLAREGRESIAGAEPGTAYHALEASGMTQEQARAECERVIREAALNALTAEGQSWGEYDPR